MSTFTWRKKFFLFKGLETQGVANKDCLSGDHLLLANLYQHLLEECLTAGAADKNRHKGYCPVNSITQVAAGQFPSEAYLFVCPISKSTTPLASQHVSGDHLFKSSVIKTCSRVFIGEQILLVTPIISVRQKNLAPRSRPLISADELLQNVLSTFVPPQVSH